MQVLKGQVAVITGGGRGIGRAVAWELAGAGAQVVVAARTVEQIEGVASDLEAQGLPARAIPCDVTDPEAVERLAAGAREAFGEVDILVNNAGIAPSAPLAKLTLEAWHRVMEVNATGTFLCTKAFLPGMMERGRGRVVTVASVASLLGTRYIAGYAASKHAVLGLTRSLAQEAARTGVTVNCVCPGYVDTAMTDQAIERIHRKTGLSEEEARGALLKMNPQGRLIDPEEVAFLVYTLCHPRARSINGQAWTVDGGAVQH